MTEAQTLLEAMFEDENKLLQYVALLPIASSPGERLLAVDTIVQASEISRRRFAEIIEIAKEGDPLVEHMQAIVDAMKAREEDWKSFARAWREREKTPPLSAMTIIVDGIQEVEVQMDRFLQLLFTLAAVTGIETFLRWSVQGAEG